MSFTNKKFSSAFICIMYWLTVVCCLDTIFGKVGCNFWLVRWRFFWRCTTSALTIFSNSGISSLWIMTTITIWWMCVSEILKDYHILWIHFYAHFAHIFHTCVPLYITSQYLMKMKFVLINWLQTFFFFIEHYGNQHELYNIKLTGIAG